MDKNKSSTISVENLSYRAKGKLLLRDISLSIPAGERVAIVGANGAGKTTLIRSLLGLIPTEKSSIKLSGEAISSYSRSDIAKLISYVPQQLPENIPFSVIEFIMMSRYARNVGQLTTSSNDPQGESIAMGIIQSLNIEHLTHQAIATLSGGEKQKVNIAAALTQQAPIIILDEPTAHLDPKQRESIQQLLHNLSRETTLITVTHDLNWASLHFDRILGMLKGAIAIDTTSAAFTTAENLQRVFDTTWQIEPHPETGKPMVLPSY